MRKTIIFGALAALLGLAAVAQASDHARTGTRDGGKIAHEVTKHDRDGKHEREARNERAHERHDESADERHEARETHGAHETAEHGDRR